jgi:multiple sugar transport system permease protein/raffinose/stachyose/melibiose transport system permease protein
MIAPAVLVYLLFVFAPVLISLFYSFTNFNFSNSTKLVGLSNYFYLFQDSVFGQAVVNTVIYSVFTIFPQIIIGFLLAVAFNSRMTPVRSAFRAAIYLPNVTSMVAIAMVWLWMYYPGTGILDRLMIGLGLTPINWLGNPNTALGSLIVMAVWRSVGFNMIVNLAGLQSIPGSLYEAATIDGASAFRKLLSITIPLMGPTTFFLLVINTINSFMVFEQVQIMTDGGPLNSTTTVVHQIYLNAFQDFRMGYAMSMAMVLFLIVVVVTLMNFRFGNRGGDVEVE